MTRFLNELGRGETSDTDQMFGFVYAELKAIAVGYLRSERPGHDLRTTTLVHQTYLKLFDRRQVEWAGRQHFFAVAAKAMRFLLVDEARRRKRRIATEDAPTLDVAITKASGIEVDLIDLDTALDELALLDPQQSRVVELKYFGGLEVAEVARVLEVSVTTVEREWRSAKVWLADRLRGTRA